MSRTHFNLMIVDHGHFAWQRRLRRRRTVAVSYVNSISSSLLRNCQDTLDVDTVLAYLRSNTADQGQATAMQRFAKQSDAPQAIPRLLAEMRKDAPRLDNNVGLQVEFILQSHPQAPWDMEPLLEGIRRKIWNSQQKCAQALALPLERGDGNGRERELAKDLIPLLASQRPRVFDAAEHCLKALTKQDLGKVPERIWAKSPSDGLRGTGISSATSST